MIFAILQIGSMQQIYCYFKLKRERELLFRRMKSKQGNESIKKVKQGEVNIKIEKQTNKWINEWSLYKFACLLVC